MPDEQAGTQRAERCYGEKRHSQCGTKAKKREGVGNGTSAKSEDGKQSKGEKKEQRKKFLGIF